MQKKRILINVYDSSDNFITTWADFNFRGFTKELNAGPGECIIGLGVDFDYDGNDLREGNNIEIRIVDRDTISTSASGTGTLANQETAGARVIYKGYISMIERSISNGKEKVIVYLLGHYTKLAMDILKDGSQTTLYTYASGLTVTVGDIAPCDVGELMRAIIDLYIVESGDTHISYDYSDVPNAGVDATYAFEQKTYRESMEILKRLAPVGTYYYIDSNGMVKFKPIPTTPTHKFIFGRHFNEINVQQNMEKVRNILLVWNGEVGGDEIYNHYENEDSARQYGRRVQTLNDYGVADTDAADLIGDKFLDENRQPEIKIRCTIIDNMSDDKGYDIETIEPGDTCSFYGFNVGLSDIFRDNMIISKVVYFLDRVEIEVEAVKSGLLDFQNQQGRQINDIGTGGLKIPETYT